MRIYPQISDETYFFRDSSWVERATSGPDPSGSDRSRIHRRRSEGEISPSVFLTYIFKCPKYEDLMDLLLEYLAKVSALDACCHINSIMNCVACTTSRYGSCHDDDLKRILVATAAN